MTAPFPRTTHIPGLLFDKLIIDSFAGGGGASLGIEMGLGRSVTLAINHDAEAVAMHKANHPLTDHACQDVFAIDPAEVIRRYGNRGIGLMWLSPDCTYHSKARGSKPIRPKNAKRRDLAWVTMKWAGLPPQVKPDVLMLENVEEFRDWGPLHTKHTHGCTGRHRRPLRDHHGFKIEWADGEKFGCLPQCRCGKPDAARKGSTFKRWVKQLENMGYTVQHRILRACDYGSPTIRKRLFVIARCDGRPIVWPEVTHGKAESIDRADVDGGSKPRGIRHCVSDQAVGGRSVRCDTTPSSGAGGWHGRLSRPEVRRGRKSSKLQLFRTAADCIDWSLPCPSIFLTREEAQAYYQATGKRIIRPLKPKTMDRIRNGLMRYVIHAKPPGPYIVRCNHGPRNGEHFRGQPVDKPFCTATASRDAHGLVIDRRERAAVFLAKNYGGVVGTPIDQPAGTITTADHHAIATAFLATNTSGHAATDPREPAPTLTTGHQQFVAANLLELHGTSKDGQRVDDPAATVLGGGNHAGLVAAFLQSYYGEGSGKTGRDAAAPLPTITTKDRTSVVTVDVDGQPHIITDIGMRMLTPRELYRCQGFPDGYIIDCLSPATGKPLSAAAQVRMCGNSVCPQVAAALVRANLIEAHQGKEVA